MQPEIKKINVELSEPQNEVMQARTSIIANIAGQGAGKTLLIGLVVGHMVSKFPEAKGFIGANTYEQLSSSTLTSVFGTLSKVFGMEEYDKDNKPWGQYVIGKQPPNVKGWVRSSKNKFKTYNNIISFRNGAVVFMGSLDNYKSHDGKEFAWAHLDETKDTKKEALTTVILGRLRQIGLWYHKETYKLMWNPELDFDVAKRQGWVAWAPCYIHTSPAEGNVEWLIELLGIAPHEKEIREAITKKDDFFCKNILTVNAETQEVTETTVCIYSSYWNEHNLKPGFINDRRARMSKSETLKFIFGYPFGRNGGEFFPGFSRFKVVKPVPFDRTAPNISSAWDFNASPYVTCLLAHVRYITRWIEPKSTDPKYIRKKYDEPADGLEKITVLRFSFFREICKPHPENTTEQTAEVVAQDYGTLGIDIFVNGDASGHSRIEGLGSLTNYKIIEDAWAGLVYTGAGWLRAKRSNIQNRKRRDFLNKIFEERCPEVEIEIDETECPNLIRDCEYLLQAPDGGKFKEEEKDANGIKVQKLGHCADAMEYLVCDVAKDYMKD